MTATTRQRAAGTRVTDRQLPEPPVHAPISRALMCIPAGCMTAGVILVAALAVTAGLAVAADVVLLALIAALMTRSGRRGPAGTIVLGALVAGASILPVLAGPSTRWLAATTACLPILVVGLLGGGLRRRRPASNDIPCKP